MVDPDIRRLLKRRQRRLTARPRSAFFHHLETRQPVTRATGLWLHISTTTSTAALSVMPLPQLVA
jgi:hypothetical protein